MPRWGACLLCRLPALPLWCPRGHVPALSPVNPAFSLLFCPHPPAPPSPVGKGETIGYFMQGASPLASPGLNPRGTGSPCRCGKLNGGRAPALPARRVSAVPSGGRKGGSRPPTLPLVLLLPPSPRPALAERSSRREGGDQGYFMQGASPLASPGLNPGGTGSPCRCGKLNGGLAPALPARRVSAVPGGGRACFVACLHCHCGARGGRARFVAC